MKHTATKYTCKTHTEARDRAQLYYIAAPKADKITETPTGYEIQQRGRTIATFAVVR